MKKKLWQLLASILLFSSFLSASKHGIVIISAPRTTSTLLMRVFGCSSTLNPKLSSEMLLEPYTQVFYLGNNLSGAGFNYQEEWPSTPDQAWEIICNAFKKDFFVIKDLAYQMLPYMNEEKLEKLAKHAHIIFLLRSPKACISSGMFAYVKTGNPQDYLSEEAGFLQMKMLFQSFESIGVTPWIIEAENYLRNPAEVLKKYFFAFEKVFDDEFLKLGSLTIQERMRNPGYRVWGELWFKNAFDTKELRPSNLTSEANPCYEHELLPYQYLITKFFDEHSEAYSYMKQHGLRPSGVELTL